MIFFYFFFHLWIPEQTTKIFYLVETLLLKSKSSLNYLSRLSKLARFVAPLEKEYTFPFKGEETAAEKTGD